MKQIDKVKNKLSTQSFISEEEIENCVKQLKNNEIYFSDIPEELRNHQTMVSVERECGIRKPVKKGYDVINNNFFVVEIVQDKHCGGEIVEQVQTTTVFNDFSSYYEFLQGDIYENACYYKYKFSQDELLKYSINLDCINFKSLISNNIDHFTIDYTSEELKQYNEGEERKQDLKIWIDKLNACHSYEEFSKLINLLNESELKENLNFFLFNFINHDKEKAFDIVMKYINNRYSFGFEKCLCLIYEPQKVYDAYNNCYYSQRTAKKYKRELKHFIKDLENKKIVLFSNSFFDTRTHFFVFQIGISNYNTYWELDSKRYFNNFDELADYLKYDLSYCDLSKAILPDLDLTKYKISESTNLPMQYQTALTYAISKKYDRIKHCFAVTQTWINKNKRIVKSYNHTFRYFFDFVFFLKNDLSNADLLFCNGLSNIDDFSDLILDNARLKSSILDKLDVKYERIKNDFIESFSLIEKNEEETVSALMNVREELSFEEIVNCQKIFYISDLHLMHRLLNANCKSLNDELFVFQNLIDRLLENTFLPKSIILIGGDTASDIARFELFVRLLRSSIDERKLKVHVVFTLGNHELWDFLGENFTEIIDTRNNKITRLEFDKIVEKYRKIIVDNKMYLLQNNLIFKSDDNNIEEITTDELNILSKSALLDRLKKARIILFGGLGFAGYNTQFNANQGIYRYAIDRQQEIDQSKKFEVLYKKICANLSDKRVVIFTHMPQKDWNLDNSPIKGFIYVNGHTHKNYFYDDGDYRIYADNQVGYYQKTCRLKYFYLEDDYDYFDRFEEGIYQITRDDYVNFYRGKNIRISFTREVHKLFMLKKNGYYMFVLQSRNGELSILNGGSVKGLRYKSLNYYYENMDEVISYIKTPLDNFSNYQKQIADEIKSIGGSGNIHGAIIDIDFYNHIYINPIDLSITAYWANDIINKIVFNDIPTLLQSNCTDIYANYLQQIESKSEAALVLNQSSIVLSPQFYLDTDVYRASREIKKMQKLHSNILSIWIEPKKVELADRDN